MLLQSLIFHYHGLDEEEEKILCNTADKWEAHNELNWANSFLAEDYQSAFERSKQFLNKTIGRLEKPKKLFYLHSVWEDNNQKGYLTEMEVNAMLNLAKDWGIHLDLLTKIREQ